MEERQDLISRQAAIDIVVFECGRWTGLAKEISKQIKQLPSAQPEPQWIPCSERLPDKKGKYLCTVHYAISPYHMFHPELDTYVDEISIQEFEETKDGNTAFIDSVVSWMPLPEPYRAERRIDA